MEKKSNIDVEKIENYLKEKNLTKKKFCEIAKISPCVLRKILNRKANFYVLALFKISWAMGVKIDELIKKPSLERR